MTNTEQEVLTLIREQLQDTTWDDVVEEVAYALSLSPQQVEICLRSLMKQNEIYDYFYYGVCCIRAHDAVEELDPDEVAALLEDV